MQETLYHDSFTNRPSAVSLDLSCANFLDIPYFHNILPISGSAANSSYEQYVFGMPKIEANLLALSEVLDTTATSYNKWCTVIIYMCVGKAKSMAAL